MIYRANAAQQAWFIYSGNPHFRRGFSIDQDAFLKFLEEAQYAHKEYTWDEKVAWAAYSAYTHPNFRHGWLRRVLSRLIPVLLIAVSLQAAPNEFTLRRIVAIMMEAPQGTLPSYARMQIRDGTGAWVDVTATAGLPITCLSGCGTAPYTLGQKAMAASVPVVISSDQSTVNMDPQGPDSQGAAQTGKPVQHGGRYYTDGTVRTFATDTNGAQLFSVISGLGNCTAATVNAHQYCGNNTASNGVAPGFVVPVLSDIASSNSANNYNFTGNGGIGLLNKTIVVGPTGFLYTSIQSAISSSDCPARGCTIYVRPDITMDTTTITISKSIRLVFDCATYLYTGTATPLFAPTSGVEGIVIEGCNRGATDTASGTVIQTQSNLVTAVSAANAPHLHIRNIAFMGTGSGTATGLALSGTRIHISDALVSGFGGTGAIIDGTSVNSNVCLIEHSRFQNNLGSGLKLIGLNTDNCAIVSGDASNNTVDGYVIASPVFATTFFGTNADGNGSGIGYHFLSGSGNNAGYIFVDTGNNITFDAGTAGNNFVILNTGAVVDNGSGDRYSNATGNSIAWNALDAFAMNLSGNTSGKITLAATAIAGANTATFPANTGTVAELNLAQTWTAAQSHNAGTLLPTAAGSTDLGSTALPFGNLWLGTAATNNFKFQPAATAAARVISMPDPLGAVNMPYVIVSGTSAMTTAGIATGACGTTVTTAATGTLTTDSIEVARNAAPTNANGGNLVLNWWPTAGNVNFNYCNPSAGTVTPTAMTINWRVIR